MKKRKPQGSIKSGKFVGILVTTMLGMGLLVSGRQVVSEPAHAQSATPAAESLRYGDSVKRAFEDGSGPFVFTFEAQAGDVIILTMVADRGQDLDPALVLIDPEGNVVAQNDDSFDPAFGLLNARLVNFPIPATGTYTIQAMRSTSANGSFTLMLRGNRNQGSAALPLEYGQSGSGTIDDRTVHVAYQFHADNGDLISITVQSVSGGDLIPYVVLLDASGGKLTNTNPSTRAPKTARITHYPIQAEGLYTISVSRVGEENGTSSGNFRLTLELDQVKPRVW